MANQVSLEESSSSSEPVEYKKLLLKVSIDCEGCRKRVNKILTKLPGVEKVDINMKQQKVTVIGDVDASYLLKKLKKSGRQVELLPEIKLNTVKKPEKSKDKEIKQPKLDDVKGGRTTAAGGCNNNDKFATETPQQPQDKGKSPKEPAISSQIGGDAGSESAAKPVDEQKSGVSAAEVRQDSSKGSENSDSLEKESKLEGKSLENDSAGGGEPPSVVEKEEVAVDDTTTTTKKVDSGNVGKKKKKKGQNGNYKGRVPSSLSDVTADHGMGPQTYSLPANHVLPRDHGGYYAYERDLYNSPPVYAASYNTSHPSSYATTSYYTALPADSYVHAYSGGGGLERELSPPSDDVEPYTRQQPLDSLEMFSDENPNGCSIM